MRAVFTPPDFVPGCEVQSITDKDEYTTDNGWIEATIGQHNQQRVRYYGVPGNIQVGDFVDVEYFPGYRLYRVFGNTQGGTATAGGVKVSEVWKFGLEGTALNADVDGHIGIGTTTIPAGGVGVAKIALVGDVADYELGPNIQITTDDDDYPLVSVIPYSHDNISIGFDSYVDTGGTARSSDAGSNFQIAKNGDTLSVQVDSGIAAGGAITWDNSIVIAPNDIELFAGAVSMLKLTETTQDLITLGPGSGDVDINLNGDMFIRGSDGHIGLGETSPTGFVHITAPGTQQLYIETSGTTGTQRYFVGATQIGQFLWQSDELRFQASQATGDVTFYTNALLRMHIDSGGDVGIGTASPQGKLHVDQASTTAATSVAYFDQADVSEEMFEFNTTIGTGNAIEAAGSKVLTTTHFVKVKIPGSLTRYFPVGTIAAGGGGSSTSRKSQTVVTQGLGANPDVYAFGFYEYSTLDANLTNFVTTQTFGFANTSYAAHAFLVAGGAGSASGGSGAVEIEVSGTSITDAGVRTTSDTEVIVADITTMSTDAYYETSKKWLGQITYTLQNASGSTQTTFSADFNYGLAKYDTWGDQSFTLDDIDISGFAGATDTALDVKLIFHRTTGWTYAVSGFVAATATNTIASLVTDHSTDDQTRSAQHFAWKRDLSQVIDGTSGEGFLVLVSTSANNAIEYLNVQVEATV